MVPWASIVWSSRGIPKQNFLTWLVVLNRCPTKDRIIGWGLQTSPLCLLCNSENETRDHLFFSCVYSASVWESLARKARCSPITSWNQVIAHMQHLSQPKHRRLLSLLAWQSAIYFVWTERNNRLHRQQYRSPSSIILSASSLIKNKISSLRQSSPSLASEMMQLWFSSWIATPPLRLFHPTHDSVSSWSSLSLLSPYWANPKTVLTGWKNCPNRL